MIVSHKHRFIYFKALKVAGTSVRNALLELCGPGDVVLGGTKIHALPRWIRSKICTAEQWKDYEKIVVARNPFDAYVSNYYWAKAVKGWYRGRGPSFKTWTRRLVRIHRGFFNTLYYFDRDGKPLADTYLRFENLERSWSDWLEGRGLDPIELGREKTTQRPKGPDHHSRSYRDLYDPGTRKLVEQASRRTLRYFGYRF